MAVTLYAKIIDGVLDSVSEIPLTARRQDTGELVVGDEVVSRLRACGYYPVDVDPNTVTLDPAKRAALRTALQQAWQAWQNRLALANASVTANSDWIDAYGLPGGQYPNAGINWPVGATNAILVQQTAALRQGLNLALRQNNLMLAVLIDMIASRGPSAI